MSPTTEYRQAYLREKQARERAETLLENLTRELYDANSSLTEAYNLLKTQNARIVQQEKLASVGFLASGLAHELNTPAAFIKSNLQTLAETLAQAEARPADLKRACAESAGLLDDSLEGIARIEQIVKSLLQLSQQGDTETSAFSLKDLVAAAVEALRGEFAAAATLSIDIAELPPLHGSPAQIQQVLLHLLRNALQATATGGEVRLEARAVDQAVMIKVSDSGPGISPEIIRRIWDPFFTTRDVGQGAGLGLTLVLSIVKRHGGEIEVSSVPGVGTTFTLRLPLPKPPQ